MDPVYSPSRIDVLPDSRLKDRVKGVVRGLFKGVGFINWIPVYCANCGRPHGYVPEESCDFACWLCTACSETWGAQFGLALMPDEVFWLKVKQEQLERYGRLLTPQELQAEAAGSSPLSKLLRDKR